MWYVVLYMPSPCIDGKTSRHGWSACSHRMAADMPKCCLDLSICLGCFLLFPWSSVKAPDGISIRLAMQAWLKVILMVAVVQGK
jgi:hypothetical protein